MPVEITYFGHSGFLISGGGTSVAIDPFLTDNPIAVQKPEDVSCAHICVTHGHSDHVGDTVAIDGNEGVIVIERFIRGSPLMGPLLYANVGMLGLLALLDPREPGAQQAE